MLPWKTIISIRKDGTQAVYLQIANTIVRAIKAGTIKPGVQLPGTRHMGEILQLNRQTIVKAYDDLTAQGWLVATPSKGIFVNNTLPEINPRKLPVIAPHTGMAETTGYKIEPRPHLRPWGRTNSELNGFHDRPDVRLVPVVQLARAWHSVVSRKSSLLHFTYGQWAGDSELRRVLANYLNNSRALQTTPDNLCITRGSQMGIYLTACALIAPGDNIIAGQPSYHYADRLYLNAGAKIKRVRVDEEGIDPDEVEKLCKRGKIRAIYVTPHHHYPTTVTLSAGRRMRLLSLAEKYGFIIFEDDYDYDFHYQSSPILPLASADRQGMVIYLGTLSKTIAPALRVGYISAPQNLINEMGKWRAIIDTQGDALMERAVAELFLMGEVRRHMKKALKEYRQRRDFMCSLLKDKLSDVIDFKIPDGGLALWAKFDRKVPVPELSEKLWKKGWALSPGLIHDFTSDYPLNCTRIGFGWMNMDEAERAVDVLNKTIRGV